MKKLIVAAILLTSGIATAAPWCRVYTGGYTACIYYDYSTCSMGGKFVCRAK